MSTKKLKRAESSHSNDNINVKFKRKTCPLRKLIKSTKKKKVVHKQQKIVEDDNVVCVVCKVFFAPGASFFECRACQKGPCHYKCLYESERFGLLDKRCLKEKQQVGPRYLEQCMKSPGYVDSRGLEKFGAYYVQKF